MSNNKVIKNASWIIGCKIVQSLLGVVISMFTARYLGPANFGLINYASSVTAFLLPIAQLGLNDILVQETIAHQEEEGKIFGTALILSLCSAVLCMLGCFTFVSFANAGEKDTIIVCCLYSIVLIGQVLEMIQYWYQAKYLSKYVSIVALLAYVVVSAYKVYLLVTEKNVNWFALSNAIDYFLIGILLIILYKRLGCQRFAFSGSVAKRILNKSRFYVFPNMMVTLFAQTDKIMLKLMLDETATGLYSAAVTSASLTSFVFSAIIDSFRPVIFESQKESVEAFEKNVTKLYAIVIYLSLLQCVGMTVLAKPIIGILYGSNYDASAQALQIIVWYTTFSYLGAVRNIWILGNAKQQYLWIINLSGALANVVLNAMLIPLMGINGAALASLATQIFTNVIMVWIIAPIRHSNTLMVRALNPKIIARIVKTVRALEKLTVRFLRK